MSGCVKKSDMSFQPALPQLVTPLPPGMSDCKTFRFDLSWADHGAEVHVVFPAMAICMQGVSDVRSRPDRSAGCASVGLFYSTVIVNSSLQTKAENG
jgi:hypothetical protein